MGQHYATSKRAGFMPAIVREGLLRRRHAMDDAAFRSCVKSGSDVSAALAALGAVSGRLTLPDPSEPIILTGRCSLTAAGLWLDGGHSLINLNATNAGLDFTGVDAGISYCKMQGSQTILPTAGEAITFTGQKPFAEKIRLEKVYNGIAATTISEVVLDQIHIRDIHGTEGIKLSGSSLANGVFGARLTNIVGDCPYPQANPGASAWKGARVASTAYSLGDIFTSGGCIYQVTTAGTTAAGTGPNGSHGTTGSRVIADGTANVTFICSTSQAWILADSFANTVSVRGAALLDGGYGIRVADSVNSGSSYPAWITLTEVEVDHPAFAGASVEGGRYFKAVGASWFGSCLSGNGVVVASAYKGGGGISQSEIAGNAQHGVLLNAANGFTIIDNDIGSNSMATTNTYNNVTIGAGVCGFHVVNNRLLPDVPGTTQQSARPVVVAGGASDAYVIRGNLVKGHAGANTITDGGSGSAKDVSAPTVLLP